MSEVATKQAVAVWEWENKYGRWRPYTPEVCQQLERSFTKGLKSVYLGDADPALSKFIVYLQPCFQQECINSGESKHAKRLHSSPTNHLLTPFTSLVVFRDIVNCRRKRKKPKLAKSGLIFTALQRSERCI
jgi:hypothetical protein